MSEKREKTPCPWETVPSRADRLKKYQHIYLLIAASALFAVIVLNLLHFSGVWAETLPLLLGGVLLAHKSASLIFGALVIGERGKGSPARLILRAVLIPPLALLLKILLAGLILQLQSLILQDLFGIVLNGALYFVFYPAALWGLCEKGIKGIKPVRQTVFHAALMFCFSALLLSSFLLLPEITMDTGDPTNLDAAFLVLYAPSVLTFSVAIYESLEFSAAKADRENNVRGLKLSALESLFYKSWEKRGFRINRDGRIFLTMVLFALFLFSFFAPLVLSFLQDGDFGGAAIFMLTPLLMLLPLALHARSSGELTNTVTFGRDEIILSEKLPGTKKRSEKRLRWDELYKIIRTRPKIGSGINSVGKVIVMWDKNGKMLWFAAIPLIEACVLALHPEIAPLFPDKDDMRDLNDWKTKLKY